MKHITLNAILSGLLLFVFIQASYSNPSLVADINPGSDSSSPRSFSPMFQFKLFFSANDGIHGNELWSYDGVGQPQMVADINPTTYIPESSTGSSGPGSFIVFNGKLYFFGTTGEMHDSLFSYRGLYSYDGLNDPVLVKKFKHPRQPLIIMGEILYFIAHDEITEEKAIWAYDGSNPPYVISAGKYLQMTYDLVVFNSRLYFAGWDGYSLIKTLWSYDGVNQPAEVAGEQISNPRKFMKYNSKLYFVAQIFLTSGLWSFEDSGLVTTNLILKQTDSIAIDGTSGIIPFDYAVFENKLFFPVLDREGSDATGVELWSYDGVNPPLMAFEINKIPYSEKINAIEIQICLTGCSYPQDLVSFNSKLYFKGTDGVQHGGLWSYDGSSPPTSVADIAPEDLTVFGNKMFFEGYDSVHGRELWSYKPSSIINSQGLKISPILELLFNKDQQFPDNPETQQ
jgi:ELWxxDGT repeat protein